MKDRSPIFVAITGLIMGWAEVIPGVSGGTVAFVAGIYHKLLSSISAVGPSLMDDYRDKGINAVWSKVNGNFLLQLIGGMIIGIISGVVVITFLLEHYPPVIWSFFFGLIMASAVFMLSKMSARSLRHYIYFLVAALLTYFLISQDAGVGSESNLYVFICGMIAISALVLPGISGSFMLLLLGMYTFIISDTLKGLMVDFSTDKVITLMVFASGCLIGLMTMARLLTWTFARYYNETIAILSGVMLGSLYKIWPWRNPIKWLDKQTGELILNLDERGVEQVKILSEENVYPSAYLGQDYFLWSLIFFFLGLFLIGLFSRLDKN